MSLHGLHGLHGLLDAVVKDAALDEKIACLARSRTAVREYPARSAEA